MGDAEIARVARIAAAKGLRGAFQHMRRNSEPPRRNGGAKTGDFHLR